MRKGDTGDAVRILQQGLNKYGFPVTEDGWYDDKTVHAVKDFQHAMGLVEDGMAGDKTLTLLRSGQPDGKLLSHQDLIFAATRLNVAVAAVCAVNEIESAGHGFFSNGKPVILFERHIMYKQLAAQGLDADAAMAHQPAIVNTVRGGYVGGAAEYTRLAIARAIDEVAAIESASWGLFQIMGYHWQKLGYTSAQAFADAMSESEANQLDAFVSFILADPALHKALTERKWTDFAKLYNGAAYKENCYDVKLARAYDKHATEVA